MGGIPDIPNDFISTSLLEGGGPIASPNTWVIDDCSSTSSDGGGGGGGFAAVVETEEDRDRVEEAREANASEGDNDSNEKRLEQRARGYSKKLW
jgi:hypothetical protein